MQRIASLSNWSKPSVPVQCSTSLNPHTFSVACTSVTRFPAKGASPSCTAISRPVAATSQSVKGADVTLPECLIASSSGNPSLPSREHEHPGYLLGPSNWLTPCLHQSADTEEQDLAAMVHDYIENGIEDLDSHGNIHVAGRESAALIDVQHHYEILQDIFLNITCLEEQLLSAIRAITLSIMDTDLACFTCSTNCRGGCIRRLLVKHLQLMKYDASLCSSKWPTFGKVPGGEYEFIDVVFDNSSRPSYRVIVDVDFCSQFEIARPTQSYLAALGSLPVVFVGSVEKLSRVLQALAEAGKLSMRQNAMPLPPWRTLSYMTSKWLSPFERHMPKSSDKGFGRGGHARPTEQCVQQLHHLKMWCLSTNVDKVHCTVAKPSSSLSEGMPIKKATG